MAPTPLGGWQASEAYGPTRNTGCRQNQYPFPHVPPSQYLVNGDILTAYDDEHNTKLETYTTGLHDGSKYTTTLPPSYTFTAEQAVCVYDEETGVFWAAHAPKDKDGAV